jgi:phosphate transport system permease protein
MSQIPLDPAALSYPSGGLLRQGGEASRLNGDAVLHFAALSGAVCILLMLASLLTILFVAAVPSIRTFGLQFLVTSEWRPNEREVPKRDAEGKIVMEDGETVMETIPPTFGALPVIYGTVVSSVISLIFAVPLSLGAAIFLIRVAPRWMKTPVSFLIEFLAAIPSIAYGLWGLFILAPFLRDYIEVPLQNWLSGVPVLAWLFQSPIVINGHTIMRPLAMTGRDMFSGSAVLGIMIIPIITAISRDVLQQVPRAQLEGTVALGATWWQSSKEMLKYSRSGLFGAVMLGLARAAGETMAVTMVIGNNNQIVPSPFAPAQTMSSLLANEFAEASTVLHRSALCEVALVLLLVSLIFNVVARWLVVGKNSRPSATH